MKKILIVVRNHIALGDLGKQTVLWLRELTDFYHEMRPLFKVDIISTSSRLITGMKPESAQGVALKLIEYLKTAKEERQEEKAEV